MLSSLVHAQSVRCKITDLQTERNNAKSILLSFQNSMFSGKQIIMSLTKPSGSWLIMLTEIEHLFEDKTWETNILLNRQMSREEQKMRIKGRGKGFFIEECTREEELEGKWVSKEEMNEWYGVKPCPHVQQFTPDHKNRNYFNFCCIMFCASPLIFPFSWLTASCLETTFSFSCRGGVVQSVE